MTIYICHHVLSFKRIQLLNYVNDVRTAFYHSSLDERALSEYGGGAKITGKRIRYKSKSKCDFEGVDAGKLPGM